MLVGSTLMRTSCRMATTPLLRRACATTMPSSPVAHNAVRGTARQWLTATRLPLLNLSVSEAFGHCAFATSALAYLDPDILNLRLLSVGSGCATLVFTYFHPIGTPLWLPFGWNLAFVLINSGHAHQILSERREAMRLPPQALDLWRAVFAHQGVSAVDFAKLLQARVDA